MRSDLANISKYIPQREPMMMVDTLISHQENTTKSAFTILADNILVNQACLSEAGLLENMAQTAALGKGFESTENNEKPPIGFIGAVKNLCVLRLPQVDERLETTVVVKHVVLNASIVEARVKSGGEEIASCELKIFLNPEID